MNNFKSKELINKGNIYLSVHRDFSCCITPSITLYLEDNRIIFIFSILFWHLNISIYNNKYKIVSIRENDFKAKKYYIKKRCLFWYKYIKTNDKISVPHKIDKNNRVYFTDRTKAYEFVKYLEYDYTKGR